MIEISHHSHVDESYSQYSNKERNNSSTELQPKVDRNPPIIVHELSSSDSESL